MLPFNKSIVSPILVGRGPELETLERALADARQGAVRIIRVELIEEAVTMAKAVTEANE